jgi:hypothetical protein
LFKNPHQKKRHECPNGPWSVLVDTTETACDSRGNKCTLFYPDVRKGSAKHPIITWGNGTDTPPEQYAYFLKHLASWGFVIIASRELNSLNNGGGKSILEAAQRLASANDDPKLLKGVFYHKLDATQVGAMGHSQGAEAAIAAMMKSDGFIKTVVPFELPAAVWCDAHTECIDISKLTQGSIFFVTGTEDIVAPPSQCSCDTGVDSVFAYYNLVPNAIPKVMGALFAFGHPDILGQPDCGQIPGCYVGVYGYLGYPTAWMMFQLKGDTYAAGAARITDFTGQIAMGKKPCRGRPRAATSFRCERCCGARPSTSTAEWRSCRPRPACCPTARSGRRRCSRPKVPRAVPTTTPITMSCLTASGIR